MSILSDKYNPDLNDVYVHDGITNWRTDIVDVSDDNVSHFKDLKEALLEEHTRLSKSYDRAEQEMISAVDGYISTVKANNVNADVTEMETLKTQIRQVFSEIDTKFADDLRSINKGYTQENSKIQSEKQTIEALQDTENERNLPDGKAALLKQLDSIERYRDVTTTRLEQTDVLAQQLVEKMKPWLEPNAQNRLDAAISVPTMAEVKGSNLGDLDKTTGYSHTIRLFTDQRTHLNDQIMVLNDKYRTAHQNLNAFETEFKNNLQNIIQNPVSTDPKHTERYEAILQNFEKSIDQARNEINERQQEYRDNKSGVMDFSRNLSNNRLPNFSSQSQLIAQQSLLTQHHQAIEKFLGEEVSAPATMIDNIQKNLEQKYEADFSAVSNNVVDIASVKAPYTLSGQVPAPAPVVDNSVIVVSDKQSALDAFDKQRDRFNDKVTEIEKFYADFTQRVEKYEADTINRLDSLIAVSASDEDKAKYEQIKTNLQASIQDTKEQIDNEKGELATARDALKDKLNDERVLLNGLPDTTTEEAFKAVVERNKDAVNAFVNAEYGTPAALGVAFTSKVEGQYNANITSKVVADDPHKIGQIAVASPPVPPPSSNAGGTPPPPASGGSKSTAPVKDEKIADYTDDIDKQRDFLISRLQAFEAAEEHTRESMKEAKEFNDTVNNPRSERDLAYFECYHDELKTEISRLKESLNDPMWIEAGKIVNQSKGETDPATLSALGAQLKPYVEQSKNFTKGTLDQTDQFVTKYEDDPIIEYYTGGGLRFDKGALAVSGGKHGVIYDVLGSGGPKTDSMFQGGIDMLAGGYQKWTNHWTDLKKDAGRFGSKGEQRALNYLENGALAIGSLWAIKHGLNMAGVDSKLVRGAILVGVIGYFIHRTGQTGQEIHDYGSGFNGKLGLARQSEYGASGGDYFAKIESVEDAKAVQDRIVTNLKNDANVSPNDLKELENISKKVEEELITQSEKGEIPSTNNEALADAKPVSQNSGMAPKDLASVGQMVDGINGADAMNDDPALNKGLKAVS